MKHAKGWEEEEDDYALFASPPSKKGPKKAFKGRCGYCGEFGHKAADCPNNKSNQNKGRVEKTQFPIVFNFSCAFLKSKTTCLHVSFTTYEYFYKLSKGASFSRWLLHPVTQKNQ